MRREPEKALEVPEPYNPHRRARLYTAHADELQQATALATAQLTDGAESPHLSTLCHYQPLLHGSSLLHQPSRFLAQVNAVLLDLESDRFQTEIEQIFEHYDDISHRHEAEYKVPVRQDYRHFLETNPDASNQAIVACIERSYQQHKAQHCIQETCTLELTRTIDFGGFDGGRTHNVIHPYASDSVWVQYAKQFEQNPAARPFTHILTMLCNQRFLMNTSKFGECADEAPGNFYPNSQETKCQVVILPTERGEAAHFLLSWPHYAYKTQQAVEQAYRVPLAGEQSVLWKIRLLEETDACYQENQLAAFAGRFDLELARFEIRCVAAYHDVYSPQFNMAGNNKLLGRFYDALLDDRPICRDEAFALRRLTDRAQDLTDSLRTEHVLWQYLQSLQQHRLDTEVDDVRFAERQGQHILLLAYASEGFARYLFTHNQLLQVKILTLACKAPRFVAMLDKISEKYHFAPDILSAIAYCRACYLLHYDRTQVFLDSEPSRSTKIAQYLMDPYFGRVTCKFMSAVLLSMPSAQYAIENQAYATEYLQDQLIRDHVSHDVLQHLVLLSGADHELLTQIEGEASWLSWSSWGGNDHANDVISVDTLTRSALPLDHLWVKLVYQGLDDFSAAHPARPDDASPRTQMIAFLQRLLRLDSGRDYVDFLCQRHVERDNELGQLLHEVSEHIARLASAENLVQLDFRQYCVQQIRENNTGCLVALHHFSAPRESVASLIDDILNDEQALSQIDPATLNVFLKLAPDSVARFFEQNRLIRERWQQWAQGVRSRFTPRDRVQQLSVNPRLWEHYYARQDGLWGRALLALGANASRRDALSGEDLFQLLEISAPQHKAHHCREILSDDVLRAKLQALDSGRRLQLARTLNIALDHPNPQYAFFFEGMNDADNAPMAQALIHHRITRVMQVADQKQIVLMFSDVAAMPNGAPHADCYQRTLANALLANPATLESVITEISTEILPLHTAYFSRFMLECPDEQVEVFLRCLLSDSDVVDRFAQFSQSFSVSVIIRSVKLLLEGKTIFCSERALENIFRLQSSTHLMALFQDAQFVCWVADLLLSHDICVHLFQRVSEDAIDHFLAHLSVEHSRLLHLKFAHYFLAFSKLASVPSEVGPAQRDLGRSHYLALENRHLVAYVSRRLTKRVLGDFQHCDRSLETTGMSSVSDLQWLVSLQFAFEIERTYGMKTELFDQAGVFPSLCASLRQEKPYLLTAIEWSVVTERDRDVIPTASIEADTDVLDIENREIETRIRSVDSSHSGDFCELMVNLVEDEKIGEPVRARLLRDHGLLDQFLSAPTLTARHLLAVLNAYPQKTAFIEAVMLKALVTPPLMQKLFGQAPRLISGHDQSASNLFWYQAFRTQSVDLSLLCDVVLLLPSEANTEFEVFKGVLKRFALNPERLFDPSFFFLMNRHFSQQDGQTFFYQWIFRHFVQGRLSSVPSELLMPKLAYLIERGLFWGDDFVDAVVHQLSGNASSIDFAALIKRPLIQDYVIRRSHHAASLSKLLLLMQTLPKQDFPEVFDLVYGSTMCVYILQHATATELKQWLELNPALLEVIARQYIETSLVRRKIDHAHSQAEQNSLLVRLMEASSSMPEMVWVSKTAQRVFYGLALYERYWQHATPLQKVELMVQDDLQREVVFGEDSRWTSNEIDFSNQETFINSLLRQKQFIHHVLHDEAFGVLKFDVLPVIIRCHRQRTDASGRHPTAIYRMLGDYLFAEDRRDFSDRFRCELYNATPKQIYQLFREFQAIMLSTRDAKIPDRYARTFMACLASQEVNVEGYKYPELIDRMLGYCSTEQLFLLLEQDGGKSLLAKRVLDHCLAHTAYTLTREEKIAQYALDERADTDSIQLITRRLRTEIRAAQTMLGASLKKKLRQAVVLNTPTWYQIQTILQSMRAEQYSLERYRAARGLCKVKDSLFQFKRSHDQDVSQATLLSAFFDYEQVQLAFPEQSLHSSHDALRASHDAELGVGFGIPLHGSVIYWAGKVEIDPVGFVQQLTSGQHRQMALAFARSVVVVETEEAGQECFVFAQNNMPIQSQNYIDCYQHVYTYLFANDLAFRNEEMAAFSLVIFPKPDHQLDYRFCYQETYGNLLPWHNSVLQNVIKLFRCEKEQRILDAQRSGARQVDDEGVTVNRFDQFWYTLFEQQKLTLMPQLVPSELGTEQPEVIRMAMKYYVLKDKAYCKAFFNAKYSIKLSGDQPVFQTAEGFDLIKYPSRKDVLEYALASNEEVVVSVINDMVKEHGLVYVRREEQALDQDDTQDDEAAPLLESPRQRMPAVFQFAAADAQAGERRETPREMTVTDQKVAL